MKEIVKFGIILFIITAVAAGALGYVNEMTKGPIEEQMIIANNEARSKILPSADYFEPLTIPSPDLYPMITEVYEGKSGDVISGYTIKSIPKGYGGTIEVITGIDEEGKITGISIGDHSETPGLGAKSASPEFTSQYTGKTVGMEIKVIKSNTPGDDEIAAVSGATISSKAVTSGVNEAIKYFNDNLK